MTPLLLIAAGAVALGAGVVVLRSFGTGYRVGRLLARTPRIPIDEARSLAESGTRRYVRVDGRIDSAAEFEDADHKPLVLRRTRLEVRTDRGWETVEDSREQVPFEVREGTAAIDVDATALDAGLVVVPRLSAGVAGDLANRLPASLPAETPVRARIEQVSSVEHAIVLGVPVAGDGRIRMEPGLGRPLVLTTLEPPEAIRILGRGNTRRARTAAGLLLVGLTFVAAGIGWAIGQAIL
ncbi:MAG: hypothetical protein WEF51_03365 [Chloroflexota bacterium]